MILRMFSSLSLCVLTAAASVHADLAPVQERVVVLISLDGLAGFYFDDPSATMPTLRKLASEGVHSSLMRCVAPTVTWPNHTTLVTGDFPARHGVVGNNYLDRATTRPVTLIGDPTFDKDQIVAVPTVYDLAKQAGLKTVALRWPASRNAASLDWTTPDCGNARLLLRYTTPSLLKDVAKAGIWSPSTAPAANAKASSAQATTQSSSQPEGTAEPMAAPGDDVTTAAFCLMLREHRPHLALLHLTSVDHQEHLFGPRSPEAYAAIRAVDADVEMIRQTLAKDFADRATIVVVSDHGFASIDRLVLPNVVLREAKLIDVRDGQVVGGPVRAVVQGGCAMIYVLDTARREEILARVKTAFSGAQGIDKIVGVDSFARYGIADPAKDSRAPDLVIFAKEGYAFGDTSSGALAFNEKPERKGTHGHDPDLKCMHALFIAWGAGIATNVDVGPFQNTDVAPTLAELLGLTMKNIDGKPLRAALTNE